MAELSTQERLQPSLLDRLTDDEVGVRTETREKRVLTMRGLRKAVLRDLGWLFNTDSLGALQDMETHAMAGKSVIAYGFPNLSGRTASGLDLGQVERRMREAIWDFEPRILRDSVRVRATATGDANGHPNQLVFEVEGQLWGHPLPERLYLKTEMDLESGEIRVCDTDAWMG